MSDSRVFASKIDTWLAAVLIVSALISAAVGIALLASLHLGAALAGLALLLIGAVLPLWILGSTRYAVQATVLEVVSGPFRWRIPLREIRSVTPTHNPLSGPALSLDRLRIDYGRRSMMISPRDKERFIKTLAAHRNA